MAADSEATGSQGAAPRQSLALYRKYRPATFAEVRGQEHVTEPLRQALRSGRINHAYLFSGPRGCGKTSSARILARSLNCVNGPTPDPCGVCDSCVALAPSGPGSIDVIEIDAASHGGVDDARDLRERAFYAPVAGRYKIYIIDEAHMVTQQGFNALLKLVEEPPPHLKFIFATTEPDKVIATIRSRTHHYPFRLMPPSVMRELTEEILNSEQVPFDPAVLPLVVRAGGGSARDTLSILDQLLAGSDAEGIKYDRAVALLGYTDASLLDEIVDAFAARDGAGVFRAVNRVIEGGHEPRRFATDMLDRFRDLIVLASVPDAISTGLLDVPPDRAEALRGQAERYGLASLTRAADLVATSLDQMRGATSPRLLLELMCAQVLLPAAATDERSLLARLERLESSAGTVAASVQPAVGTAPYHPERRQPTSHSHPASSVGGAPSGASAAQAAPSGEQPGPAHPARTPGQASTPGAGGQTARQPADYGQPGAAQRPPEDYGQPAAVQRPVPVPPSAPGGPAQTPGTPAAARQPEDYGEPAAVQRPVPVPPSASGAPAEVPGTPAAAQQPGIYGQSADGRRPAPGAPPGSGVAAAAQRPAPAFTHAREAPGAPTASAESMPAAARGAVTVDAIRQAWPSVMEAIKAQRRVAWMIIGNASVASFDEGVLTLRFPRQGDVKGFQGGKYEDLVKQVLNTMFGINVVIRAVTGGGDAPAPARRPGPPPVGPPAQPSAPAPADYPRSPAAPSPSGPAQPAPPRPAGPAAGSAGNGHGEGTPSFGVAGVTAVAGGDHVPLPPPPDEEDFDPDDEGMSVPVANELTGMALVQRELGAQVIAEYDD